MTAIGAAGTFSVPKNAVAVKTKFGNVAAETAQAATQKIDEPDRNAAQGKLEKVLEELFLHFAEKLEKSGRTTLAGILRFAAEAVKLLSLPQPKYAQD